MFNVLTSYQNSSTRKSPKIDSIDVHRIDRTTNNVVVWFLESTMYVAVGQSKRGELYQGEMRPVANSKPAKALFVYLI